MDTAATIVQLVGATYTAVENVKVYREQCRAMSARCRELEAAYQDSSAGLEGHKALELVDELTFVITRITRKVEEWAALSRLRSFLQQREIKDSIDRLNRDIDNAVMKVNVQLNLELARGQLESRAIQDRDKAEIRELLDTIVRSTDDMRTLIGMQAPEPAAIVEVMESLQNELRMSTLDPDQEHTFRQGLWELHANTQNLPPLPDLTGQVTMSNEQRRIVAKGLFNDIFQGEWLDKEPVALRLPRALANNPNTQKRFQREVGIWRKLTHENIVPLYGIVYFGEDVYSVSPWMDNGTSITYVQNHTTVDRLQLLSEVTAGLEYLHAHNIVHGDLRGANVLINRNGIARLSDFGLSKFLEDCGQGMTSSPGINPRWSAPELLQEHGVISTHSDIWSFGMLSLELLTGEQPYSSISRDLAVMHELDKYHIPSRPGRNVTARGLSDTVWALMRRCWHKKPVSRPSASTVRTELAAIRGLATPPTTKSPGRLSFFNSRRPSTAGSVGSSLSKISSRVTPLAPVFSPPAVESQTLSPISIQISSGTMQSSPVSSPVLTPSKAPRIDDFLRADTTSIGSLSVLDLSSPDPSAISNSLPKSFGIHLSSPSPQFSSRLTPSTFSSMDSNHLSLKQLEETTDPQSVIILNSKGNVVSGTLEGLADRLIKSSNARSDMEFRDVLLISCVDFTSPEKLFDILCARFRQAEAKQPAERVEIQYNIFTVTTHWITSTRLLIGPPLLWQMKEFYMEVLQMKQSTAMSDKARSVMHAIDTRTSSPGNPAPLLLSPGRKIPKTSEIVPRDLAIALTLMEGDQYSAILPSEYLLHLQIPPKQDGSVSTNNIDIARDLNNKIVIWIKKSILHYDKLEDRSQVLKFFINTAHECRLRRNFSSVSAIASALQSRPIERLRRTKASLPQQTQIMLSELQDILDPAANHSAYRKAINTVTDSDTRDVCIPWMAVHLKELHNVLQKNPANVRHRGRLLINFERYVKFMERLKEVLHYRPPDLEQYRTQGPLAYLEHQLRNISVGSPELDQTFLERSDLLEANETRQYLQRTNELASLGFRVKK